MRRKLSVLALLATTALTPAPAQAGPILPFITGLGASIGIGGTTAAVTVALSGAAQLGFAVGSFFFGTALGQLALSIGLSAISASLSKPNIPSPSDRLVNFAQSVAPMEIAVGRVRKGGPYGVTAFQGGKRHYGVMLAAHEIDGVEAWYIDDRLVEVEDGLVTTSPYDSSAVSLRPYLGAAGQTADAEMVAAIPEWTAAHDMAGLAYVAAWAARVKDSRYSEVYGNSAPTGPVITPAIRGAIVYDPRTDSWGYSNNAALVLAWVTTERLGQSVYWDEVATEADASDVLVTNRQGNQQRKWTINAAFSDDTDYETLRAQIIAACDGYMFERPDGTLGFKVGRWVEPTITLTEDDFFSLSISVDDWGQAPPTEFVAQYVEPDFDWREAQSATLVVDADAVPVRQEPKLYFVDSHNQACRILKRIAATTRPRYSLQGQIGAIGYELLEGHRFVRVLAHGFDFVCDVGKLSRDDSAITFKIQGVSATAADFAFDAGTEEGERPARNQTTSDDTVPPVTGLTGTAIDGPAIEWEWDPVSLSLSVEWQFRVSGESVWQPALTITDGETLITQTGLTDGESYEARVRSVTGARRYSAWSSPVTVTAVANATPPAALQAFAASEAGGTVTLDWQNANDPSHVAVRIIRADYAPAYAGPFDIGDGSVIGIIYGAPNAVQAATDSGLAAGVYAWWAVPINSSGIAGAASGPETIEIT